LGPLLCEADCAFVLIDAGCAGIGLGLFDRFDLPPVVWGWLAVVSPRVHICQKELVGLAMFGIAASAVLDADKAESLAFADCRRYPVVVDAVLDEVLLGDRQAAVLFPAVVKMLDFDAVEDAVTR
jgi:hypothetical protein